MRNSIMTGVEILWAGTKPAEPSKRQLRLAANRATPTAVEGLAAYIKAERVKGTLYKADLEGYVSAVRWATASKVKGVAAARAYAKVDRAARTVAAVNRCLHEGRVTKELEGALGLKPGSLPYSGRKPRKHWLTLLQWAFPTVLRAVMKQQTEVDVAVKASRR